MKLTDNGIEFRQDISLRASSGSRSAPIGASGHAATEPMEEQQIEPAGPHLDPSRASADAASDAQHVRAEQVEYEPIQG